MKRAIIIAAILIAPTAIAGDIEVILDEWAVSGRGCTIEADTYIDRPKTWRGSVLAKSCEEYMYYDSGFSAPDDAYLGVTASLPEIGEEIKPCIVIRVATNPTKIRLWCDEGQIFRNRFD